MWNRAKWLKVPQHEIEKKKIYHGDMTGRFAYFRCEKELPDHVSVLVDISANSRYRLWVNETPVLSGPCKGDLHRQYYETVDLTPYLRSGKNVFCAQVLYSDPDVAERQTDERAAIYGVISHRIGHRFALEGEILNTDGNAIDSITTGDAEWRVYLDDSFYLKSSEITCYLGAVTEEINFTQSPGNWKKIDFNAAAWENAEPTVKVMSDDPLQIAGVLPRMRIREREIPLLYEHEDVFLRDFIRMDGSSTGLLEHGKITVLPGCSLELILDAGVIKNGYPRYVFNGGVDAAVSITYFEKFGGQRADLCRSDYINGEISGLTDTIRLAGDTLVYEPFWVRTFRFVCITICAAEQAVTLEVPTFRKTGYPIKIESTIRSSQPWVERLWDICVRTLKNCMMETYMDCPYYEQLQFAMDTRLEALFTYAVTNDHALVRKALIDFHYGMLPEGLTYGKYPSVYIQVLSTFSLHYIYMLWEYYNQTGDMETVRICRGDVDRILDYYDARIGTDGLVGRLDFWEFVDWQDAWQDSAGIPKALEKGPSTIINLMYAYALDCAACMSDAAGRKGLAEEYRCRRKALLDRIQTLCWDEERTMYREGPDYPQFTQHAQAWAVLNDLTEKNESAKILSAAIESEDCLKCSFSTSFEWFRALEKAGMYPQMRTCLDRWIGLLDLDCTTCPEEPNHARSDCHAWSALPMFEMMRTMAGIHPVRPGSREVLITPQLMDLPDLEGTVVTPGGAIQFYYQKTDGAAIRYAFRLPEGMRAKVILPDGRCEVVPGGYHELFN